MMNRSRTRMRRIAVAGVVTALATLGAATLPMVASAAPDDGETRMILPEPVPQGEDDRPDDRHDDGTKPDDGGGDNGGDDDNGDDNGGGGGEPGTATIAPGARMVTGNAGCTANFVYTDGTQTLLGYAAHCAATGGATDIDGCSVPPLPTGTPVEVFDTDGVGGNFGSLVYSSWAAMQANNLNIEENEDLCTLNDFALVALDAAAVEKVDPTVPIFGGPDGLSDGSNLVGNPWFSYQPNIAPGNTMPAKQGTIEQEEGGGLSYIVTPPLGMAGDSGSGYMSEEGLAFGSLSTLISDSLSGQPLANGVTALSPALDYANENPDTGALEGPVALVEGTVPFSAEGVDMNAAPNPLDVLDLSGLPIQKTRP